jgi:hypothetical protein
MKDKSKLLEDQLRVLVIGLADQEIKAGRNFKFDGGDLHADEVAELITPSMLCIAQRLSERLGTGDFGFQFELGDANPVFPLHAKRVSANVRFFQVAPFVTEVFERNVLACRADLSQVFELAAQTLHPEFSLSEHTNHTAPVNAPTIEAPPGPIHERTHP